MIENGGKSMWTWGEVGSNCLTMGWRTAESVGEAKHVRDVESVGRLDRALGLGRLDMA